MRKLIIIFFWAISIVLNAGTYYVSPTGDDSNPGTITEPWKTWGKAFNAVVIQPGDTVFFRGGVYMKDLSEGEDNWFYPARSEGGVGYSITRDGTITDTLCYFAYPPDIAEGNPPILDCINAIPSQVQINFGIRAIRVTYVKFWGLTIRNVYQQDSTYAARAFYLGGSDLVVENCTIYNVHGDGYMAMESARLYYINCDAHHCADSLRFSPGNQGTGFFNENTVSRTGSVYYNNCRAWLCSDQGFAAYSLSYTEYNGCWSFRNGYLANGAGIGFKLGFVPPGGGTSIPLQRKVVNNLSLYNRQHGFTTNDNGYPAQNMNVFNNTAFHNGYYPDFHSSAGFILFNTTSIDAAELERIFKNNISYHNEYAEISAYGLYTHEYNSWDNPPGVTITDADFISVDSTGITAPRQADGSLPDNDCYKYFLRPSSTFTGYQQGVDVDLTYDAVDSLWRTPPSIGFKEYYPITPAVDPVLADISTYNPTWLTTTTASSGGFVADDGGGTVSVRGVCWNTTGTPTTADSKTEDGTGNGAFTSTMTGLTQGTTYYVRAYATNEAGTAYGSQMTFRTQIIKHLNKVIKHLGKFMIIN
jgi:hypothetical protein